MNQPTPKQLKARERSKRWYQNHPEKAKARNDRSNLLAKIRRKAAMDHFVPSEWLQLPSGEFVRTPWVDRLTPSQARVYLEQLLAEGRLKRAEAIKRQTVYQSKPTTLEEVKPLQMEVQEARKRYEESGKPSHKQAFDAAVKRYLAAMEHLLSVSQCG